MEGKIFSPGKLLLTSEYVVLDGALALAVPTQLGQEFFFEEIDDSNSLIFWEAKHQNQSWLFAKINYKNWEIEETNLPESAEFIKKVLKNVQQLSETKFQNDFSYRLETNLQFPADFGLGSSSTLMNNLAVWAEIDAFLLNELSLGGSGYDIAVAKENSAILYQNNPRKIERIEFNPKFKDKLIFIHLNQKQDSREGIKLYREKVKSSKLIEEFSELTMKILKAENLGEFSELMVLHEEKLSKFLGIATAKEKYFQNCPSFIKSLGAWGGDFVLASKFGDFENYFLGQNFSKIYEYNQLIS